MLESHPVPQSITSYEFKLVGDMTLKQFGQLAGGVVVALICYALPIYPVIKWPLVIFFGIMGVLLAFVPFQERPLSLWIFSFFKAVYAPTQFLWQKKGEIPDYFTVVTKPLSKIEKRAVTEEVRMGKQKVEAYLSSLPQTEELSGLEKAEREFLAQMNALLVTPMVMTEGGGEQRKGAKPEKTERQPARVVIQPPPRVQKREEPVRRAGGLPEPVTVTAAGKPPTPVFEGEQQIAKAASFAPEAPIPVKPTQPNIIVGQVLDKYGRIIEKAIIEIRDEKGVPMRALRSNRLGHFQIVTPLPNGKYTIETEQEGYRFDTVSLTLTGEVIQPISVIGESLGGDSAIRTGEPVLIYKN